MDNRILRVEIHDHSPQPAMAELHVVVVPEKRTETTEVRGRLMGPRCLYSNTVEIAYPLRPLNRAIANRDEVAARVIIPEASPWEPESPFLYQGPVELWQEERCCDRLQVSHGLRHVSLVARGLFWNGRSLRLRGWFAAQVTEAEAQQRRQQGFNLIVAPVTDATSPLWQLADRVGLLVLGRPDTIEPGVIEQIIQREAHPSCLGWLLDTDQLRGHEAVALLQRVRVGVLLSSDTEAGSLPSGIRFTAGPARSEAAGAMGLPHLLLGRPVAHAEEPAQVLGWVE